MGMNCEYQFAKFVMQYDQVLRNARICSKSSSTPKEKLKMLTTLAFFPRECDKHFEWLCGFSCWRWRASFEGPTTLSIYCFIGCHLFSLHKMNFLWQGLEEFMTDLMVIFRLQYRNLIKTIACCAEGLKERKIYWYMITCNMFYEYNEQLFHVRKWPKFKNILLDGVKIKQIQEYVVGT